MGVYVQELIDCGIQKETLFEDVEGNNNIILSSTMKQLVEMFEGIVSVENPDPEVQYVQYMTISTMVTEVLRLCRFHFDLSYDSDRAELNTLTEQLQPYSQIMLNCSLQQRSGEMVEAVLEMMDLWGIPNYVLELSEKEGKHHGSALATAFGSDASRKSDIAIDIKKEPRTTERKREFEKEKKNL